MPTPLVEIVETLPAAKVVLVGDFMLDKYIFGSCERISPEAPIPILRYDAEEFRLGGAGFVLAALATLGAKARAIGIVGDDEGGREIKRRVHELNCDGDGIVTVPNRPTVTKIRLLGSSQDRAPQQILRLDMEETRPIDPAIAEQLLAKAAAALDGADLLCLEDYNKGVLPAEVTRKLIALARQKNIPVLIDPASLNDYSKYRGATALKLNRPEVEKASGLPARTPEQWRPAAEKLLNDLDLQAVVVTLNDVGSYLATRDGARELVTSRSRQVADATGAGDMVLAMLCMAAAAGASWSQAVALGNVAAGIEVEKLGCVPVTTEEVVADLLAEEHQTSGKQRTVQELLPELARHKAAGKRIVFTNGCFDLIHLGHVKYFQFAKAQGDLLVVGVNTDNSIRRLKGTKRPIINEADRVSVLEELESIDYLVRFDEDTPLELIQAVKPDVLVKGADYQKEQVIGWDFVERCGGKVALAPLVDGRSTSAVIQRILEAYK
jgi:D-beta-D-heptose 7-phosphate kinase/D-beta-D-heptose 1-phosphate adenosyltransferase